tara:strand:- start:289 stop:456 length:168 start_codon:yes stop_codon:yes gene_type:complete
MDIWEVSIIKEYSDGVLLESPNGDIQFLTHNEYLTYNENIKKLKERYESRGKQNT